MAAGAFSLVLVFFYIFSAGSVDVKFATGSTQTLRVNAERDLKFIEWKHKGALVVEWYGEGNPTQYLYNAKLNTNTGDLTITMQKDYSGEYKCQYQYKDKGTFDEIVFQVEVIDPFSKPRVTCKKNFTDITLKCTADSSAQADFTWNGPDGFSHVGQILHITNPETKDLYFCTANNKVSKEFKLTDCPTQGSVDVKFATGSTQTLRVNAERALKFIEWKHKGALVVEWYGVGNPTQYRYNAKLNTTTGDLTITMQKDNSGEYKCQYQYKDKGTFDEIVFQVEVIGSVEVKKFATGSTQTLRVNAQRDLKFIEWKHKGNLLVEWYGEGDPTQYRYNAKLNTTTGDFTIKMQKDYSGEYKCQYQFKDKATFDEIVFQVEVIDPVFKPRVTCEKNVTNITLKCTMESSAQANFNWKGPDDFSHVGDSVHITNPETKDSYFCTAKNEVSEETAEFKLTDCPSQEPEDLYFCTAKID